MNQIKEYHTSNGQLLLEKESLPYKLYRSITDLTLDRFIICLCDHDLSVLIKKGNPPADTLCAAWDTIFDEYLDRSADSKERYLLRLSHEMRILEWKIEVATFAEAFIRDYYPDDRVVAALKKIRACEGGYPETRNLRVVWFKKIVAKVKSWIMELEEKKGEMARVQPQSNTLPEYSREYFDSILVTLSQFMKFHINERTITVSRYLAMLDDYKKYCETLKRRTQK